MSATGFLVARSFSLVRKRFLCSGNKIASREDQGHDKRSR